ncbi:MAG: serine/threonine-protein kinase [Planctomycetota bacterium]
MSSIGVDWYRNTDSLVGELRRGGYGPAELPKIPGFDDIREIRRGGQGIVFSAIQRSTKRRVAIKVLLEGAFASVTGRRRFEREIDLVAGLRHPNIVNVHDSGVTSDGRLYFVMEYVDGLPLDQYVVSAKSSNSAIADLPNLLRLMACVCDAIHYAHQRGVIHRDLKPGNILVDATGSPHVCDFGLAKAMTGSAMDQPSDFTMSVTGQFMGSLPWASPEQIEGSQSRIDVRSDVYSLGVVMFQTLAGRLPHETSAGIRHLFDQIANVEPLPPSDYAKGLNNEIDTIVMKALAKDTARRYQSAAELADDIRHYLAGEPIQAKRDSAWYTLRKTVRRYQAVATIAAIAAVGLTFALAVSLWSWRDATRARDEARTEASQRAAIDTFLQRMLTSVDPNRDGREVRLLHVIDRAAAEMPTTLKDQPRVAAQIHRTLGSTYASLGKYESAEKQLRAGYELIRNQTGTEMRETLELLSPLSGVIAALGRHEEAEKLARTTLAEFQRLLGNDDPLTLLARQQLGHVLNERGESKEAEEHLRSALAGQRRIQGDADDRTLTTMDELAVLLKRAGRFQESEALFREALDHQIKSKGTDDPGTLTLQGNFALALQSQGKLDEAEAIQRKTLQAQIAVLGEDHPDTLTTMSNFATLLIERRKPDEAEKTLRRVAEAYTRTLGAENPATLTALNNLAKAVQDVGRLPDAEKLFRDALDARKRVLGPEHGGTLLTAGNLASVLALQGRLQEAADLHLQVLEARRRTLGDGHFDTIISMNNYAIMLQKLGKLTEAADRFREAVITAEKSLTPDHFVVGLFRGNLGRCESALGQTAAAAGDLLIGCENLRKALGINDPRTRQNMQSLVDLLERIHRESEAKPWRDLLAPSTPTTTRPASS